MDKSFFLLLTFFSVENIYASKILLLPYGDKVTSHHTRMTKMGTYLYENGHQVSMVMPSTASHLLKNSTLKLYEFQLPKDYRLNNGLSIMKQMSILKLHQVVLRVVSHTKRICYYLFSSTVASELKQVGFDLVIVDTASSCMKLLADYLNTTVVQYSSWGFFGDHSLFYPNIPSVMCPPEFQRICIGDRPSFSIRLQLVMYHVFLYFFQSQMDAHYEEIRKKYKLHTGRSLQDFREHTLVITTIDFTMDAPAPLMPHIIAIPGLLKEMPKTLPKDLEEFIQGAGQNGTVVVAFGTNNDHFKTDVLISVL